MLRCSMLIASVLLLGLFFSPLQNPSAAPGKLTYAAPAEWKVRQPSSSMRVGEWELPPAQTGGEPGEIVIYYFGGGGGSVEANVERWLGQFRQADGKPVGNAKRDSRTVHGLTVSMVEVSGTYVAEMRPGATEHFDKPGYRMRAAVIDTPRGPYFVKMVGPDATIAKWGDAFGSFIDSIAFVQ